MSHSQDHRDAGDEYEEIILALQRELEAPVRGAVLVRIMNAVGFSEVLNEFVQGAAEKLRLARGDDRIHDFTLLLPYGGRMVAAKCFVHPGKVNDGTVAAREDLYVSPVHAAPHLISAVLQFSFFAGAAPLAARGAWLPLADAGFDDAALTRAVIPWRNVVTAPPADAPPDGACLVELARTTVTLTNAMQRLILIWPDEGGPVSRIGLEEARDELRAAVIAFNAAAKRCRLAHRMPLSVFDATWLPHNLQNAVEYQSLRSTIRAELRRTWGNDGAAAFDEAHDLFARGAGDDPRFAALRGVQGPPEGFQAAPAPPPARLDAFVCYSWADKTRGARDVYEFLRHEGMLAWLDEELRIGDAALDAEIAGAIQSARAVIVCISREMVVGGGYALRELLFALDTVADRIIVVRLDRFPLPPTLAKVKSVDWFAQDGAAGLRTQLAVLSDAAASRAAATLLIRDGPILTRLLALLQRPPRLPRPGPPGARWQDLVERAELCEAVVSAAALVDAQDWQAVGERVRQLRHARKLPPVHGPDATAAPTLAGPAFRLRFCGLLAELQRRGDDWGERNRAIFELIDDLLNADLACLTPVPEELWTADNCRAAARDCLDAFHYAREWLRGWSPRMLTRMSGIPAADAAQLEPRISAREADLADRMLALRILEDSQRETTPGWSALCSSIKETLRGKWAADGHPAIAAYFGLLGGMLSPLALETAAVAMADAIVGTLKTGLPSRDEFVDGTGAATVRFVVRSYLGLPSTFASLALAKDTVLHDLMQGSEAADVTILVSTFTLRGRDADTWQFETTLNVLPHPRPAAPPDLSRLGPILMPQMLSEEELEAAGELLNGEPHYLEL